MEDISRRGFVGAMGAGLVAGVGFSGSVVNVAGAKEASEAKDAKAGSAKDAAAASAPADDPTAQPGGVQWYDDQATAIAGIDKDWQDPSKTDPVLNEVMDQELVDHDVTLPDGTVVPAVYVNLRNRIDRMGKGVGTNPGPAGYQMIMHEWSEEDAAHELEMPFLAWFNAYDYAMVSGRDQQECAEILKDMASRCLIYHVSRGGNDYYTLLPHINGFWEFCELKHFYQNGGDSTIFLPDNDRKCLDAVADFNACGIFGPEHDDFINTFPLFHSYPISKDVIAEDEFQPYMDWRAIIRRQKNITVSPCQCRLMWESLGIDWPTDQPTRTCLSLGEMAEYFKENGIGEPVTQDEAIAIVEDAIDHGMVPESIATRDVDIICCCHGDSCGNLKGFLAGGGNNPSWKNFNAYVLSYDKDTCIRCGACIDRCPMHAIEFGDDGFCLHNTTCVRCGQCVSVCPVQARVLRAREDFPEYPYDYLDCHEYYAKDRMLRGDIADFTDDRVEG